MNNVILIGMPGCGKTSVADVFGWKCNERVWDTDGIIETEHGKIAEIFSRYGEKYFRDLETETLKRVCAERGCLISVGGGCVLREENVRIMKSDGNKVVYLRTTLQTLEERLKNDTTRPLLRGDAKKNLKKLYGERAQIYERIADITVDTDGLTAGQVFDKICLALKESGENK